MKTVFVYNVQTINIPSGIGLVALELNFLPWKQ